FSAALEARDQVRPFGIEREDLDRDAFLLEHRLHVVGDEVFVARRILGVLAQERLKVLERFGVEARPVGPGAVLGPDTASAAERGDCNENGRKATSHKRSSREWRGV